MKIRLFFLLCLLSTALAGQSFLTPFERDSLQTATYLEAVDYYQRLAAQFPDRLKLTEAGPTDSGLPLHLAVLSADGSFEPAAARSRNKTVLLINNAIHPGEPCGVDATMMLVRDLLQNPARLNGLRDVVILVIPFYNISGGLNRGSYSRANQQGPKAYGFRGNAQNLDLNRDFVKCDTRNAATFNQLFSAWRPHVFIDNHTSNGADYQYTMTLLATQPDKLGGLQADYLRRQMLPYLYRAMADRGDEMIPYVNVRDTPDEGIYGFLDLPRYSSGYAVLHHCLSFVPEAHMLKPFAARVRGTYRFMEVMLEWLVRDGARIRQLKDQALADALARDTFELQWRMDLGRADTLQFKGYTAKTKRSEVSGLDRLYYDRAAPFTKAIPFYTYFRPSLRVAAPTAYVIPQAYDEVIERLRWNGVQFQRLPRDTTLEVEQYYIDTLSTLERPFEGHYLHYGVRLRTVKRPWTYRAGDYLVSTDQPARRYLIETLEPQAPDSYFAWNFFDGILAQKEYFSDYVFEDLAAQLLLDQPELRLALEQRRREDPEFAASGEAQLNFIYERSPYYEVTHRLYPVGRIVK